MEGEAPHCSTTRGRKASADGAQLAARMFGCGRESASELIAAHSNCNRLARRGYGAIGKASCSWLLSPRGGEGAEPIPPATEGAVRARLWILFRQVAARGHTI